MNTRNKGNKAENKACEFLINKEYKIIERNFYFKGGEIDIIALKNNVIHFIEVKSGNSFEPIFNITHPKIKRIIKGAYIYMKKTKLNKAFCIDAIIIKNNSIEHIKNITL